MIIAAHACYPHHWRLLKSKGLWVRDAGCLTTLHMASGKHWDFIIVQCFPLSHVTLYYKTRQSPTPLICHSKADVLFRHGQCSNLALPLTNFLLLCIFIVLNSCDNICAKYYKTIFVLLIYFYKHTWLHSILKFMTVNVELPKIKSVSCYLKAFNTAHFKTLNCI